MNEQYNDTLSQELINILLQQGLSDGLKTVAQTLMNTAMLLERQQHLNASPYQRGVEERNGFANGFKPRTFQTALGALELSVPQVRESETPFRTSLLEKGSRSERALKSAIATMYINGVSTRKVTKVMEKLCGFEVSSTQVSNLNKTLDEEFHKWRTRPLPDIQYLILDATYYDVRIDGAVRDCATLKAIGVRRDNGKRMVLGVSCALSEAEVHWRTFLDGLKERGMGVPDMVTSDAHSGLKKALKTTLNSTPWQRCQFHLQQNAQDHITKQELKTSIAEEISSILTEDSIEKAQQKLKEFSQKWQKEQPKVASWAEDNIPQSLTVLRLPKPHRKKLRTSNSCETLNGNIKRRTRVAGLFPSEESLERLVTGVLIEISETWETSSRPYLSNQPK